MTTSILSRLPARRTALAGLPDYAGPQDPTQRLLARIWQEALGLDRVGIDDDFFALGGTSLQAAKLFDAIERECGERLPLAVLYEAATVRQLASRLGPGREAATGADRDCVVPIETSSAGMPLFVIPGIGGNVVGLRHLGRELGRNLPVYGLRSRGLEDESSPLLDVPAIASDFLAAARSVQPEGPMRLLGICWGAMVGMEMARQLQSRGEQVGALLMLDPPPPGRADLRPASHFWHRTLALPRFVTARIALYARELRQLPSGYRAGFLRSRVETLLDIVRRRDLLRGARSEFRRMIVTEANAAAAKRYACRPISGNVQLIFTADRPDGPSRRHRWRWRQLVCGPLPAVFTPGRDTGDALAPGHVEELADIVRAALERMVPSAGSRDEGRQGDAAGPAVV